MIRAMLILLITLLAASPALADYSPRPTQIDDTNSPRVTVYLTREDLAGINHDAIRLYEDHHEMTIETISSGSGPLNLVLIVDSSGSMADPLRRETAATLATSLIGGLTPGDQIALLTFGATTTQIQPFTSDPASAAAALRRLRPEGGTALYDAVASGVDLLRDIPGRRAVIVVADGRDCRDDPACPVQFGSQRSLDDVSAMAASANIPIYTLAVDPDPDATGSRILRQLMERSDSAWPAALQAGTSDIRSRRLIEQIHAETVISYTSPRVASDRRPREVRIAFADAPSQPSAPEWPAMVAAIIAILVGALLLRRRPRDIVVTRPAAIGSTIQLAAPRAFCIECGREIQHDAHYCAYCGAPRS